MDLAWPAARATARALALPSTSYTHLTLKLRTELHNVDLVAPSRVYVPASQLNELPPQTWHAAQELAVSIPVSDEPRQTPADNQHQKQFEIKHDCSVSPCRAGELIELLLVGWTAKARGEKQSSPHVAHSFFVICPLTNPVRCPTMRT